jgi:hypothetical protein
MSLISELKRRNVLRVAAAYVVTAWLVIQVVETIFPVYGLSDTAIRFVITALAIGFVPVLILAWIFEFTPEGIKRDSDVDVESRSAPKATRNFDRGIMVVLVVAISTHVRLRFLHSRTCRPKAIRNICPMGLPKRSSISWQRFRTCGLFRDPRHFLSRAKICPFRK